MRELQKGENVTLVDGSKCRVMSELGRGGQGIVYLVNLCGHPMALKWYARPMGNELYKNLQDNISKGAPSDAFLWPLFLTRKVDGCFGYIMHLRPQGYYEFGDYLLRRGNARFESYEAILNAAMRIAESFYRLHLAGLSYQDLNDGNFFINPTTGDVLICDNDNVMPEGQKSGIMGKMRYMAPEVVMGAAPNKQSDRFSLAVILFMLLYRNHPLEGRRLLECACMTEENERTFYGSDPVFIYDLADMSNRPLPEVHSNVVRLWPNLPSVIRNAFIEQFSRSVMLHPEKRMLERQWGKLLQSMRDTLVRCPHCGDETFVEISTSAIPVCVNCGLDMVLAGRLEFEDGRNMLLTPGTTGYVGMGIQPDLKVIKAESARYPLQICNLSPHAWSVQTPSGQQLQVLPGKFMPVRPGLKIRFESATAYIK